MVITDVDVIGFNNAISSHIFLQDLLLHGVTLKFDLQCSFSTMKIIADTYHIKIFSLCTINNKLVCVMIQGMCLPNYTNSFVYGI